MEKYSTTLSAWAMTLPSEPEQILGTTVIDHENIDNESIDNERFDRSDSMFIGISLDHRQDDFRFSIGYANPGERRPDTLSKLDWSNQDLVELTVHIQGTQPG